MGNQTSSSEKTPLLSESDDAVGRERSAKQRAIESEIVSTERTYVASLTLCVELYMEPLRGLLHPEQLSTIFSVLERILELHRSFLTELEHCILPEAEWSDAAQGQTEDASLDSLSQEQQRKKHKKHKKRKYKSVGAVFLEQAEALRCYSEYVNNYDESMRTLVKCRRRYGRAFERVLESAQEDPRASRLDLLSLLIMPVQRLPRYVLLLRELLRELQTSTSPTSTRARSERRALSDALAQLQGVCDYVNDEKRRFEQLQELVRLESGLRGWQQGAGTSLVRRGRCLVAEYPLTLVEPSLPKSRKNKKKEKKSSKESKNSSAILAADPVSINGGHAHFSSSNSSPSLAPDGYAVATSSMHQSSSAGSLTSSSSDGLPGSKKTCTLWLFNDSLLITKQLSAVHSFFGSSNEQHKLVMFALLCTSELLESACCGPTASSSSAHSSASGSAAFSSSLGSSSSSSSFSSSSSASSASSSASSASSSQKHGSGRARSVSTTYDSCSRLIRTTAAMLSLNMRKKWPRGQQYFELRVSFENPNTVRKFRLQFERLSGEQRRTALSPSSARLVERLRTQVAELKELEMKVDLPPDPKGSTKISKPGTGKGSKASKAPGKSKNDGASRGIGSIGLSKLNNLGRKQGKDTKKEKPRPRKGKGKKDSSAMSKLLNAPSKVSNPFKKKKKKKKNCCTCSCFGK